MSKPEEFKFDSRVRDRFLRNRVLSASELQKHLDELPDLEGQLEVLSDTPQPAVTPPRSEVAEEPLVFDGIRRLQALSEANNAPPAPRFAPPPPASSGLPAYREPEARPLGTPLRSALMESEISGVGAGAVSAALGAMAAEARGASVFGVPNSIPRAPAPASEPVPPVTLRSELTAAAPAAPALEEDEDDDDDDDDIEASDDEEDEDDDDDDDDVEASDDAEDGEKAAASGDDEADVDDDDDDDDDDADDDAEASKADSEDLA
jgi:hypothetical protein